MGGTGGDAATLLVRAILTTLVPSDAKGSTLRGPGSVANATLQFKVELASESYDRYDVHRTGMVTDDSDGIGMTGTTARDLCRLLIGNEELREFANRKGQLGCIELIDGPTQVIYRAFPSACLLIVIALFQLTCNRIVVKVLSKTSVR